MYPFVLMRELGNWYSRGYLPHFDEGGTEQAITYRLADALPSDVQRKFEEQAANDAQRRDRAEHYLDAGHGCCALRLSHHARAVIDAWKHFDGQRYRLLAWVVMPNHVHILATIFPAVKLGSLVQTWKSYTARTILAADTEGYFSDHKVWQREYWDRFIRDETHHHAVVRYIHENPVKAGLVTRAEDWPWSSASRPSGSADVPVGPV